MISLKYFIESSEILDKIKKEGLKQAFSQYLSSDTKITESIIDKIGGVLMQMFSTKITDREVEEFLENADKIAPGKRFEFVNILYDKVKNKTIEWHHGMLFLELLFTWDQSIEEFIKNGHHVTKEIKKKMETYARI